MSDEQRDQPRPSVEWTHLGEAGPRVSRAPRRERRDLGPGGSHRQEAERARALRQPRRWHGIPIARSVLAAGVVAFAAAVILGALASCAWAWVVAVVVFLAAVALLAAGVVTSTRRPTAEVRLLTRARAETRIAAELDPLAVSGWTMLHDRVLPGGEHRLAHVAVGPAGVFVIEPLPFGVLRIVGEHTEGGDDRELYDGPLHLGQWLATRRWELGELEPAIAAGLADMVWTGPTASIAVQVPPPWWRDPWRQLVRRGDQTPDMPYDWGHVTLRPLSALVETLAGLPAPLDRAAVSSIAATVAQLCPAAGYPDEPPSLPSPPSSSGGNSGG